MSFLAAGRSSQNRTLRLGCLMLILPVALGSTCIVVQEEREDVPFEDESNVEQLEDEEREEMDRRTGF